MLEIGYNYYGDTMEGTKSNKNKKATSNTSKKTKRVVNEVSSDELLEQILSKKKANKKSSTKKSTTVSNGTKRTTTVKITSKKTKQFNSFLIPSKILVICLSDEPFSIFVRLNKICWIFCS